MVNFKDELLLTLAGQIVEGGPIRVGLTLRAYVEARGIKGMQVRAGQYSSAEGVAAAAAAASMMPRLHARHSM